MKPVQTNNVTVIVITSGVGASLPPTAKFDVILDP